MTSSLKEGQLNWQQDNSVWYLSSYRRIVNYLYAHSLIFEDKTLVIRFLSRYDLKRDSAILLDLGLLNFLYSDLTWLYFLYLGLLFLYFTRSSIRLWIRTLGYAVASTTRGYKIAWSILHILASFYRLLRSEILHTNEWQFWKRNRRLFPRGECSAK